MGKRCVIYRRASLDATGEERSVDRQLEACEKHAALKGYEVVAVHTDNSISAYAGKDRPGWKAVLDMIEAGQVDIVLAWHLDRMTRSMLDLEHLIVLAEDHGVGIATVTGDIDLTTDVGRMVARILAAVARAEVERKAARQRLANEQRAASGKPWSGGARPFGYTADQMHLVDDEADAIRVAAEDVLLGTPLRQIALRWDAAGLYSSRAFQQKGDSMLGGWSARGVRNVLLSPRYVGVRTYRGEEVGEGLWPTILDTETHLALKALLGDPSRRLTTQGGKTPRNLLTRIARCTTCQVGVNASAYRKVPIYTCKPHGHVTALREVADEKVAARMVAYLSMPDVLQHLVPSGDVEADEARDEADAMHARLTELMDLFSADAITSSQLTDGTKKARARLDAAEAVLAQAGAGTLLDGMSIGTDQVVEQWNDLPLSRKRGIIEAFLDVEITPIGRGQRDSFDPDRHMTITLK